MVNPPYGERIESKGRVAPREVRELDGPGRRDAPLDGETATRRATSSPRLAAHWKHAYTAHPAGWTAWILSPDRACRARCG